MADPAATATDKLIAQMEKRMNTVYRTAQYEMEQKLKRYMRDFSEKNKQFKKDVKAGKKTQEQYDKWLNTQAYQKKWLEEMVNTLTTDATLTDVKAMSVARGFLPEAYAVNRNYGAFEVEKGSLLDTSFTLYDAHTVERIVEERPKLLPLNPSPDIPKEQHWHKQQINNAVVQGILQGESLPDIAKRLQAVTDMDNRAALRNARTATTAAQNAGRVDSYKDAEKMGIKLKQQWMATLDGRTRESHRHLDGEVVAVGEKFSNGCEYPGDPSGEPAEIYNCRCTLIAAVEGHSHQASDLSWRYDKELKGMSYEEWKYGKEGTPEAIKDKIDAKQAEIADIQKQIGNLPNQTYSGIWKNDVTLADYMDKKDSIPAKENYYNSELSKLYQKQSDGTITSFEESKIADFEKKLVDLEDFKQKGLQYEADVAQLKGQMKDLQDELADLKKDYKAIGGELSKFDADAYTEARKNAAMSFTDKYEADKFHRAYLDSKWDELTDYEKYGTWKYTENSNPMNKPLSGYTESWSRSDFQGVGNVDWGREDRWRNLSTRDFIDRFGKDGTSNVDHYEAIKSLTTAIDKMELPKDCWFVRGSDNNGLAGLFEGNLFSFDEAMQILNSGDEAAMKAAFEGQVFQSHSFLSTGIASGTGFSGEVKYSIYAPQGTHAIYAEPQSYFGSTINGEQIYEVGKRYSSVGGEAETIFQRGTEYRVSSISYDYGTINVELEVVNQPDYFVTGAEETFNNGATIHPKK